MYKYIRYLFHIYYVMRASEISRYSSYEPYVIGIIISILYITELDNRYKKYILLDIQSQCRVCTMCQSRGMGSM